MALLISPQPESGGQRPWASSLRTVAAACFHTLGLPTAKDELWKYTNVSRLAEIAFRIRAHADSPPTGWESFLMTDAASLVLIGGRHARGLGTGTVRDRWRLDSLAHASRNDPSLVEPHLGRLADIRSGPFAALNTAMMSDGAFVYAPPHTRVPVAVQVLHLLPRGEGPTAVYPRLLIVAGEGATITVVESWLSEEADTQFLNVPVTEIVAGEGAVVNHYVMVREGKGSHHLGSVHAELSRGSRLDSTLVLAGSAIARRELHVVFRGGPAQCDLQGLYAGTGRDHVDVRTVVDHAVARCESRQRYRGVLGDEASAVFHGRVIVRPDAAKTDASQHNANLLLGDGATANSRPQLEIFADDVRCTHGASTGQLDEDAMFYLRTRGMDERRARSLLTRAFANEVLDAISEPWVRATAAQWIDERLASVGEGGGEK